MQDPDPKCRHFVISWHFMAFWHVCQKANCITKSAFSAFSRLFPPFRLFHRIRLLDFPALIGLDLSSVRVFPPFQEFYSGPHLSLLLLGSQISKTWIRCRWFRCASIGSKYLIFGSFDNDHVQLTLTRALQIENRSAKRNQKTLCIEIRIFCKSVLVVENVSKVFAHQQTDPLHPP